MSVTTTQITGYIAKAQRALAVGLLEISRKERYGSHVNHLYYQWDFIASAIEVLSMSNSGLTNEETETLIHGMIERANLNDYLGSTLYFPYQVYNNNTSATRLTDLIDGPGGSLSGSALKYLRVNATGTAWEFVPIAGVVTGVLGTANRITVTGGSLPVIDIASNYSGQNSISTVGVIDTGIWRGTLIEAAYTEAKLISLAGTTDRVTIGGTVTDPIVDIASTYAGQTSITTLGTVATGVWNATIITTTYTQAQLISLTGTANRITLTGTATDPIVDIASTYVGQISITTLGTIATGTWNATILAPAYGGTGVNNASSTITIAGNVVFTGGFITTITTTADSNVTLPTSGTLYGTQTGSFSSAQLNTSLTDPTGSGFVVFGTAPSMSSISLAAGTATAGTAPLYITQGTNLTSPAAGAIEWDGTHLFITQTAGPTRKTIAFTSDISASTVNSVSGTANRITSTGGTDPVIDISAAYVGQSSITTVGTLTGGATGAGFTVALTTSTVTGLLTGTNGGTGVNNGSSTITIGGNLTFSGAYTTTITLSNNTSVSLPTSGTLYGTQTNSITSAQLRNSLTDGTGSGSNVFAVSPTLTSVILSSGSSFFGTAPLKFTSGTNLSTAEIGAMEWDGTRLYMTQTSGPTRQTIAYLTDISGAATVSSVSGTTNRITSTGGATPVIDIAATYVGQSSITTLGTIGTGVWQGTLVGATYGGTGINNGSSTITIGGSLTFSGAFTTAITVTAATAVILPTSGRVYSTKSGSMTSTELRTSLTSSVGTGNAVFAVAPTIAFPVLQAGTATAGQGAMYFNTGVNLTSPESGAVEWDGVNLFITQASGPTRKTIAYTTDIPAATVTSIIGTANQITASAATGAVTLSMPTNVTIAGSFTIGSTSFIKWGASNGDLSALSDGVFQFRNNAHTTANVVIGLETSSGVSIKNSGTSLQIRLGDDSAFGSLVALAGTFNKTTNQLILGTTNTVTISSTAPSASRVYTLNDFGADAVIPLSTAGNTLAFTTTGATGVTLPTSGTLYGTASGSITSSQLRTSLTDETGTGAAVFSTAPSMSSITLAAGTATVATAPIYFTSGTNLTAAAAGAVEWDGVHLFITQTSGPTRKQIAYTTDIGAGSVTGSGTAGTLPVWSTSSALGDSYLSQLTGNLFVATGTNLLFATGYGIDCSVLGGTIYLGSVNAASVIINNGGNTIINGSSHLGIASASSYNKVSITTPSTNATLTLADTSSWITSGAFSTTVTSVGTTTVTLPTSGTLYGTQTGSFTSLQLKTSLTDETGSGFAVFATGPSMSSITLAAGTTSGGTAPIYFTSGTNLTTPVAGAFEWDGTRAYLTQTSGPARQTIAYLTDIAALGGVTSITGTANQITASASTGAVTLSMPSNVTIASTLTVPSLFGSASSSGNLTLGSTSNATKGTIILGTTDNVTVGGATTTRIFTVLQDTAFFSMGSLIGTTSQPAIYMNQAAPAANNFVLTGTSSTTTFNGNPQLNLSCNNISKMVLLANAVTLTTSIAGSGAFTNFSITNPAHTGQTASTNIPSLLITTTSRQWATGAITTQQEVRITSPTYSFVSASTITDAYTFYVSSPTAGTNATITNSWAAGFNGRVKIGTPTAGDVLPDLFIGTSATTSKGLVIQALSSQTANMFEVQDSTGAIETLITAAGYIGIGAASNPSVSVPFRAKYSNAGALLANINNTNSGTGSYAGLNIDSNSATLRINTFSSTYTTSNYEIASTSTIQSGTAISMATSAAVDLTFWTNSTKVLTVASGGQVRIDGTFKLVDGSQGLNKVLTSSDTNGLATWGNVIISGTQTPGTPTTTNVSSITVNAGTYSRNGNIVTVSGSVTVTATGSGVDVTINLDVPIATTSSNLSGNISSALSGITQVGGIFGIGSPIKARILYVSTTTSAVTMFYTYQYLVV